MPTDQGAAPEFGPSLRLAELLCARLCCELDRVAAIRPIVDETEAELRARLDLARAAWTAGDDIGDVAALRCLVNALPGRDGARIDLRAEDGPIPAGMGRVLLNLVMAAAECLPLGGTISLGRSSMTEFAVLLDGPGAAWPAGFAGWIANPALAWRALHDARAFQAPLSVLMATAKGYRLSLLMGIGPGTPPLLVSGSACSA
jgi:hypothetical protein